MQEMLIKFGVPVLTALLSFLASVYKAKNDLKNQQITHEKELEKLKEQHKSEIEKIKIEIDKQAELYEKNAQTDFTKEVMSNLIKNPDKTLKSFENMMRLAQFFQETNKKDQ